MSRFQFVADHRDAFEVKWLCEIVEVSRSSFYAWLDAAPARAERAAADAALAERIRTVQRTEGTEYGAPRITAELNDGTVLGDDDRVNHKRVARVMREHGIAGLRLRRKVRTTVPEPSDDKVPDLLKRDFTATAPNTKYVGDITYLPYDGGHLYLATVIDCCSRRLVGWSIAEHMRTDLVQDALRAAQRERGGLAGAFVHHDHGAQGGFNRSSQHLEFGGGGRWRRRTGAGRPAIYPRVRVGSGVQIGRCGRRCARLGGLSPRGRCSDSSGS